LINVGVGAGDDSGTGGDGAARSGVPGRASF